MNQHLSQNEKLSSFCFEFSILALHYMIYSSRLSEITGTEVMS
jgi:hypothetical protein